MTFIEAMIALLDGKKVRRKRWIYGAYIKMEEALDDECVDTEFRISLYPGGHGWSPYSVLLDDWEIVE